MSIREHLEAIDAEHQEALSHLDRVTTWLEGTEAFRTSHGVHSDAVEARKFLARETPDETSTD